MNAGAKVSAEDRDLLMRWDISFMDKHRWQDVSTQNLMANIVKDRAQGLTYKEIGTRYSRTRARVGMYIIWALRVMRHRDSNSRYTDSVAASEN